MRGVAALDDDQSEQPVGPLSVGEAGPAVRQGVVDLCEDPLQAAGGPRPGGRLAGLELLQDLVPGDAATG